MTESMDFADYAVQDCANRREWLFARKHGIGASEAAALVTIKGIPVSNWGSPWSIYVEKVSEEIEEETTERQLIWGTVLEPGIRKIVGHRLGCQVLHHGPWSICWRIHTEDLPQFQFATLDGWIDRPNDAIQQLFAESCLPGQTGAVEGPGVVEIKSDASPKWEKPPLKYVCQVQHQLSVTGYDWGILGVYFSLNNQIVLYPIRRDQDMIRKINATELKFWRNHVEAKVPPPTDGSDATKQAIGRYYDDPDDSITDLPKDVDPLIGERQMLKESIGSFEERIAEIDNYVRSLIGDHTIGFTPDGCKVTWKQQTRKEYLVKESTFRVLRYPK